MILNYMRFPGDGIDVIQATLDWESPLEPEPFEAAWQLVARRHEVLRTTFRLDDGDGLIQVADPDASLDVRRRDLPQPPASGPDQAFESFLRADRRESFEPTQRPPVRLTILRWVAPSGGGSADSSVYRAVLTFHHALLDGRSMRLVIEEACAAYAALRAGRAPPEPPSPPFGEFVRWWQTTEPTVSAQFWTEYLAGVALPQPLPGYLGEQVPGREPRLAEAVAVHGQPAAALLGERRDERRRIPVRQAEPGDADARPVLDVGDGLGGRRHHLAQRTLPF